MPTFISHGIAHTRPFHVAGSMVDGKCASSSARATHGDRSSSHPARANSATQTTSSIITSKAAPRPSRLITKNWCWSSEFHDSDSACTRTPGWRRSNSRSSPGTGSDGPRILACLKTSVTGPASSRRWAQPTTTTQRTSRSARPRQRPVNTRCMILRGSERRRPQSVGYRAVCGAGAAHVISFNDMPPHALGSGTISFGLVSIPIKLYTATASGNIAFNLLHAKCGSRIKQQTFCPVDNEVVERSGLVKGYEFAKDQYVRVTDEELKALEGEASKMIDILEFVPLAQVDPVYFEKAYYLGADKGGEKPYRLLADAMAQAEQVAVAKFVMRGKESLVLIRSAQDGLLLHTMFFADEVRSFADIDKGRSANVREGELGLALKLIRGLANEEFKPEQYKDDYRARVQEMLERKIEGREVTAAPAPAERPRVIDLMDALKASLAKRGLPESAATAKKPPSKAATVPAAKVAAKAVPKRASGGRK